MNDELVMPGENPEANRRAEEEAGLPDGFFRSLGILITPPAPHDYATILERGWLIEEPGPRWWTGGRHYAINPNCAIRFSRRVDAERVIANNDFRDARAIFHQWDAA